jgi:hypothetical protein
MFDDAELQLLRASVHCVAVLERMSCGWKLDMRQSTRRALKYRRREGEILIISHNGRGWWDPLSRAKGDVFDLVQHLDPSLNFGQVRQALRQLLGNAPSFPGVLREEKSRTVAQPIAARWSRRPLLRRGSAAWRYLTDQRALTAAVIEHAAGQDAIREGHYGSAWFAHRDAGQVSHVEIRGPDYKGSLRGGRKSLFRYLPARAISHRLAIAEAPIDALSLAVLEECRPDTLYVGTGGGMGPGTIEALQAIIAELAHHPDALIAGATDANVAGDRHAQYHAEFADAARVRFERLRPPDNLDWNDVLTKGRGR